MQFQGPYAYLCPAEVRETELSQLIPLDEEYLKGIFAASEADFTDYESRRLSEEVGLDFHSRLEVAKIGQRAVCRLYTAKRIARHMGLTDMVLDC